MTIIKPFPALCRSCSYATDSWPRQCTHPEVIAASPWAPAKGFQGVPYGVECSERNLERGYFAPCGIEGKLWKPKEV